MTGFENVGVFKREKVWLENSLSQWLRLFSSQTFPRINTPTFSNLVIILHTYPPMKMEKTKCSETSAYKIQTPGNYPEKKYTRLNLFIKYLKFQLLHPPKKITAFRFKMAND